MRLLIFTAMAILLSFPAQAAFDGPGAQRGGFSGPAAPADGTTVSEAKKLPDDSIVVLTGNIVAQVPGSDDNYIFRDSTGEIRVDIDHKYFRGQHVTPQNTVRISGEVDKDLGKAPEIDVKQVEVLK